MIREKYMTFIHGIDKVVQWGEKSDDRRKTLMPDADNNIIRVQELLEKNHYLLQAVVTLQNTGHGMESLEYLKVLCGNLCNLMDSVELETRRQYRAITAASKRQRSIESLGRESLRDVQKGGNDGKREI